jgi:hypothetical protein
MDEDDSKPDEENAEFNPVEDDHDAGDDVGTFKVGSAGIDRAAVVVVLLFEKGPEINEGEREKSEFDLGPFPNR